MGFGDVYKRQSLDHLPLPEPQRMHMLDMQYTAQSQSYAAAHPDAVDHVMLVDETPVGRLWAQAVAGDVHIIDLAIAPDHQAKGLGTRVLTAIGADIHGKGRDVSLRVFQTNPAVRLYARLGFETVADEPPYQRMIWRAPS